MITRVPKSLDGLQMIQNEEILTTEEQAWLAQNHTVQVRVVNIPPFITLKEDTEPEGISIDYLNYIGEQTGVTFKYIFSGESLPVALDGLINHTGPDVISSMMRTPERENSILFSKDYFSSSYVIFTHTNDKTFISDISDLYGRSIALPKGTVIHDKISKDYPDLNLVFYDNDALAIEAVADNKADAYIGNLTLASYLILEKGLSTLRIAGPSPFGDHAFSMGTRNDWPELVSIMDKVFTSMSEQQKAEIRNKYIFIRYEPINRSVIIKWIASISVAAVLVILLFVFWNRTLARQVEARTADLQYHATLLDNVSDAVVSVDMDFRIISWNDACERIYGWKMEEVMGKVFAELTDIEYQGRAREEVFGQVKKEGSWRGEVLQTRKDGGKIIIQASISLVKNSKDEAIGYVGVNRDITKLKKSEEYFSKAFYSQGIPMAIINIQTGERVDFNDSYIELTGYTREELQRDTLFSNTIGVAPEEQGRALESVRQKRRVSNYPITMLTKSGETKQLLGSGAMLETGDGNLAITAWVDITERKKAEEIIRENQKRLKSLASKLTIVEEREKRRIATDLHDHIGTTLAYTRIQLEEAKSYATESRLLTILDEISQSLLKTIQETRSLVFDLSSPLLTNLGLSAAISNWMDARIGKKHGLRVQLIEDNPEQSVSDDLRAILFRNVRELLTNVVKHARASQVTVSFDHTDKDLIIMVQDDGIGFPTDELSTEHTRGEGFGLFSIKERMEDFGGSFEISSNPGKGCKASLSVPIH